MKKYSVEIKGKSPYMQHRMDDQKLEEWEKNRKQIIERDDVAKEDLIRAEYHAYRNSQGKLYIPAEHLMGALIGAGALMKSKVGNARKSMKNIVAGMFSIQPFELPLRQDYEIDKRSAVNKLVKARIIVLRPKWPEWGTKFELHVDNDTLTDDTVKQLITDAGNYIGIGSFRPVNNGPFGRFEIVSFKAIK